jgi:hypothetical protein
LGILSVVNSVTGGFSLLIGTLWIAFSVTTNVTITSFIIAALLKARRLVAKSEMYDYQPRIYRDVIILLVESAAPLAVTGVCAVVASGMRISGVPVDPSKAGLYLFDYVSHILFLFFAVSHLLGPIPKRL